MKAMSGSILAPNSGSYCEKLRIMQVAKWDTLKEDGSTLFCLKILCYESCKFDLQSFAIRTHE